jgi:hypothetical protein
MPSIPPSIYALEGDDAIEIAYLQEPRVAIDLVDELVGLMDPYEIRGDAVANARRIAACVNALAGTPLPHDIELGAITQRLYASAQALTDAEVKLREKDGKIARLTARVEAAKRLVGEADIDSCDIGELHHEVDRLHDILASIETALTTDQGGQSDG